MTDTFATTARPPRAAIAWATRDALYCEIPCKDGPPLIIRERLTTVGLTRVLNLLIENPEPVAPPPQTAHPKIKRPLAKLPEGSAARDAAAEIVRKLLK